MATMDISAVCIGTRTFAALVLVWASAVDAGELHRWVDEGGEVHYTDAPPPESARGPESDAGQAGEREADATRARTAADERAAQSRRDHVLRQSYSSVADIERTRDRRLDGVDGEIGLAEHRVEQARQRIDRYDRLLTELPEDNEHRVEMKRQRAEARERLQRRREELEQVRAKRMRMEARFTRDIERFRELMSGRD